jgi:polygalacturonase
MMDNVENCFTINMFYNCDPDGRSDYVGCKEPLPVGEETPTIMNIVVSNTTANNISGCALFFYGLPESPVTGVKISNSSFMFLSERETKCPEMMTDEVLIPNLGVFMKNVVGVVMEDVSFDGEYVRVED